MHEKQPPQSRRWSKRERVFWAIMLIISVVIFCAVVSYVGFSVPIY